MIQATCIQKFKKNNRIYGYRLQDSQGNTKDVYADQLKQAIRNQQIAIINLTLTSDNRLIDTTPASQSQQKQPKISEEEQKIKNLILKATTLGLTLKEIPTYCKHKCYLISQSPTQHLIYIPDDVDRLNKNECNLYFTKYIKDLQGTLKIVGGENLQDSTFMFYKCKAQFLDLHSFNTSKVTDMKGMFKECKVKSLELSNFDTSKVTDMLSMFQFCEAQSIDLSNFNTSNVTDMGFMFDNCKVQSIDLSNFNTSKVTGISYMFQYCEAQIKTTDTKILKVYKER